MKDGWTAEDWQVFFDDRASFAEFDAGVPRGEAEARAYACCVTEWLNRNYEHSPPRWCLYCGGGDLGHDPLVPYGTESTGYAWLHSRCWPVWHANRRAKAVIALAEMGIAAPADYADG
jgi:hypothetical protein